MKRSFTSAKTPPLALMLIFGVFLTISGCGQKGPLYLPDSEKPQNVEKKDSPESDEKQHNKEQN